MLQQQLEANTNAMGENKGMGIENFEVEEAGAESDYNFKQNKQRRRARLYFLKKATASSPILCTFLTMQP